MKQLVQGASRSRFIPPQPALLPLALGFVLGTLPLACTNDSPTNEELSYGTEGFTRDPVLDVPNVSEHDEARSHNQGLNCMRCHQSHGPGRGQFTVAGTVTGPDEKWLPNPVVELHDTPPSEESQVVLRIEGDLLGNFFTTEEVPFPDQALFVRVRSRDSTLVGVMPHPTSTGTCNHCHAGGFRVRVHPIEEHHGEGGQTPAH